MYDSEDSVIDFFLRAKTIGTCNDNAAKTAGAIPDDSTVNTLSIFSSANKRANSSPKACINSGST